MKSSCPQALSHQQFTVMSRENSLSRGSLLKEHVVNTNGISLHVTEQGEGQAVLSATAFQIPPIRGADRCKLSRQSWLFAECLNEGDLSVADQLVSPDFTGPAGKGPDAFKAMISPLRQGFPDLRFIIQDMVAEGSRGVVRWTWQGTHRGMLFILGATGGIGRHLVRLAMEHRHFCYGLRALTQENR
jgi:predicted ester cyclase